MGFQLQKVVETVVVKGLPMSINKEYKKSKAELRKVAVFKGQTEK